jgi:hypothetical protein
VSTSLTSRRSAVLTVVVLLFGLVASSLAQDAVRTVRGELVAVNVKASPKVIVVRAMMPGKKELIVGATVESGTTITRGGKAVRLEDLRVGESLVLRYMKNPDGLVAQSIQAQ